MMKQKIIISSYDDINNPYYAGGGAMAVHKVARNLKDKFDITVITAKYPGAVDGKVDNVFYKRIGPSFAGPKIGQLIFQILLPFYAKKMNYDLWIESFTPPFSTAFLPLFTKKPVIGLAHMLAANDMERKYKLPFHIIENFGLSFYKSFIVTTSTFKEKVRAINRQANITVIPVGIDKPSNLKRDNGDKYILFIGRIEVNQKGLDLLLKSYKLILNVVGHKLIIAGSGTIEEENKLKRLIKRLNLENKVVLYGRVSGSEKDKLFRNASIITIPSRYETFGLVALEAMSYEIPTITYDIEGFKWNNSSIKVSEFDYVKYSEKIIELIKDVSTRDDVIRKGNSITKEYTWDSIFAKYTGVINQTLNYRELYKNNDLVKDIIKNKTHCYFVSPHLDDAVFSAGYLLSYLSKHTKVTVLNVFTSAGKKPYTLSAKAFLKQTNYSCAQELLKDRVKEDKETLEKNNIEAINLGFEDALWRKKAVTGKICVFLSKVLPEFIHIYPTYRWHVIKKNITQKDFLTYSSLRNKLRGLIEKKDVVFCPVGYGEHIDHLITREACRDEFENVVYWSDFPYCLENKNKNEFIDEGGFTKFSFESSKKEKMKLILGYKSQIPAIFGDKEIPLIKERYFSYPYLIKI